MSLKKLINKRKISVHLLSLKKLFGSFNKTKDMTFTSSTFRPKLKDQEYMELVFENGQIIAKGQRSNVSLQDQRTKSIFDLYEAEYNEDFKKSVHGCGGSSIKNLVGTQVVPDYHVFSDTDETNLLESNKHVVDDSTLIETLKASSSKKIEFIPPDEQSVVAEKSVFESSSTDLSEDSEGSTCLSTSLDDARPRVPTRTRKVLVKRKRSLKVHNSLERKQRKDINKKMRTLQDLLPNSHEEDNESLLDEAINYMRNLQLQVQMMTMSNRFVTPSIMLPVVPHYSQMGLATGVPMGVPQFPPTPVLGAGFPGISNSENKLRFLNHPGLMPMQDSALFTPAENCYPQSVPPLCTAFPTQAPNSTSLSTLVNARPNKRTQGTLTDGGVLSDKHSEKP